MPRPSPAPATPPADPLVSVVVIAHDDAQRLPRAVGSVLAQGIDDLQVVVVDDGSTDGTAEVATSLGRADHRVEVLLRPVCSGRPGPPRNQGLEAARGRWVMFLDSDDEHEPGAIGSLLSEAARAEAAGTPVDVVLGRTTRVNPFGVTTSTWMPWLSERPGVTTLAERPELVGDSLLSHKLVRREVLAGLRFPEDIVYEDVVFASELSLRSRAVSVTQVPVHRWHIRPHDDDRSITNSRRIAGNLEDRLEANLRIGRLVDATGRRDLRLARDRKVVDHDLRLVLRDLVDRPADLQADLAQQLRDFLPSLDPAVLASTDQPGALVLALLQDGPLDRLVDATVLAYRRRLVTPVDPRPGGGFQWQGLAGPAGDVSSLVGPLVRDGRVLRHQVTAVAASGPDLLLRVRTTSVAGPPPRRPLAVALAERLRRRPAGVSLARGHQRDAAGVDWEATLRLGPVLRRIPLHAELALRVLTPTPRGLSPWPLEVAEGLVAGVRVQEAGAAGMAHPGSMGQLCVRRTA